MVGAQETRNAAGYALRDACVRSAMENKGSESAFQAPIMQASVLSGQKRRELASGAQERMDNVFEELE